MVPPRLDPLPLFKDYFSEVSTPSNLLKKHNDGTRKAVWCSCCCYIMIVSGDSKPFYHLSCCWVLFPSPPLGPIPWTHSLLTHPAASPLVSISFPLRQMPTQLSEPSPLCPSHCWLWQHHLGVQQSSLHWLPASLPLPSAVNLPLQSLGKISVFLIYCKTKGREPKSQLLMIAAVLLTFSRAKAVLHCFTSRKDEPSFCQWTDANLLQQRICLVGLGFSVDGLIGVGG